MLRTVSELKNSAIHATDGKIGHLKDFYFDSENWAIRYLIVETKNWPMHHKVLISPLEIDIPNYVNEELSVRVTGEQLKSCENFYITTPQYRQNEQRPIRSNGTSHRPEDHRPRSYQEIIDFHIVAVDGNVGRLKGMFVDTETWVIHYIIVNIGNWWLGHQVLISSRWIKTFNCRDNYVAINLARQTILDAPIYDWTEQLSSKKDREIQEHYSVASRWIDEVARDAFPPKN